MSDSTLLITSIIAAIIPTIIYIAIIYWFDRYEKEPWWLLVAAFLWGAIPSIIVAFIFNTILSIPVYLLAGEGIADALSASLIAPPVEETVKGLALLMILLIWRHEIDSPLDGIIYGAMVGMGFAMVENVYYFVNVFNEAGTEAWSINIFMRGVIFGLNHALFTSMTGLGIGIARMSTNGLVKFGAPILGWMMAMFLHFLHNAAVSTGTLLCFLALIFDWGGVLLTLAIILWAVLQERQWLKIYLAEEVHLGTMTLKQYEIACSGRQRTRHSLDVLVSQGFDKYRKTRGFYHRCSELAYTKHHFSRFQDAKHQERLLNLRQHIADNSLLVI